MNKLNIPKFKSNQGLNNTTDYINSGVSQINFLIQHSLLNKDTNLLDFGCGQGRIANSLEFLNFKCNSYVGIDTDKKSINWCNQNISYSDMYKYVHLPAFNKRYNKTVNTLKEIPFPEKSFDLIFLNSVFSHMLTDDIIFYLNEFKKLLNENGKLYFTAFVEYGVPNVIENPENYLEKSTGPLHRVRYSKHFIDKLISDVGLTSEMFIHRGIERTSQSIFILSK